MIGCGFYATNFYFFICLGIISIFFIGCDQATQQTQNTSNTGREDVIEAPEEMPQDFLEETQQDVTENIKEECDSRSGSRR